jgi:hypothetical protein
MQKEDNFCVTFSPLFYAVLMVVNPSGFDLQRQRITLLQSAVTRLGDSFFDLLITPYKSLTKSASPQNHCESSGPAR